MILIRTTAAVALFVLSCIGAAAAPVVILSGEVDGQGPGSLIDDATEVSLPAGAVLMFNDATGQTRTLTGPYDGPIGGEQKAAGQSGLDRLMASRSAEEARLGAIRTAPGQSADDPDLISVAQTSVQCLRHDGEAQLWRPTTLDADSHLTITDASSGDARDLVWHGGTGTVDWPDGLAIAATSVFRIDLDIALRPVVITLHRAPAAFSDTATLADWMSTVGCRRQALALLDQLVN